MNENRTPRMPIAADVTVTDRNGNDIIDATGAGAPGAFMLECAAAFASPRAKASRVAATPGMRRFLNAGIRSADGVASVTLRDAKGNELVEVVAVRREEV